MRLQDRWNRQIVVVLSCLFAVAAQATDWHWKGAEGAYSLTDNTWETDDGTKGVVKGSDAIAVFDGDATLVWANTSGTQPIGGIKVLAGTVTFNSTYNITRPINFANITNDIYVAPGATLILNGHSPCGTNGAAAATQVVRLTGGGTLRTCGGSQLGRVNNDNLLCRFVVCADSTLEISGTTDGVRLDDALVVEAGGVAKMLGNNLIQNSTVIHVEKGGEFRADGFSDTLGALTGDGLVVIGAANLTLPAEKGPFAFGGLMKADIALGATTTEENQYCLVTTARAFENCSFATAAVAGGAFLRFAPGVGEFWMKQYRGKTGQPLILEDTSGRPIRVHTLVNVDLSPVTDGSGDYIQNGGTLFYGAATLGHSGAVGVENGGVMTLGDLTSAQDMDLDRISAFESWGTGELRFKQSSAASVDAPLLGDGKVTVYNDMTFARFRKIGGDLQLSQDGTDVILTSPNATLNKIAYYNTGTAVTVNGGRIDGTSSSRAVALIGGISSSFTANEADVRTSSCEVGTIAFNGGRWTMTTSFGNPVGTSTKPQCVCIDGATVQLGDRNASWGSGFETVLDKSPYRAIYVKSGGMKLQVSNETGDTLVSVGSFLSGVDGSEPDGGVTVGGFGLMRLDGASWGVTGPVVFNDSLYRTKAQAFAVTGPVTFGTISLSPESESVATTVDFSAGETKVYGSATLQAAHASQSSHGCVRLGRLTREKGGVLFLRDASTTMNFFDGISYNANPAYTVTVPLATNDVNGATRFPVFAYACTRTDGKATSRYNVRFLTCRSDGSFAQVAEKAYAASLGANELALVDNVSGESTVATDQTLAGLTVYGRNGNALSIAENVTLTLGNGQYPAVLLLNNSHQSGGGCATVAGGGTLNFGTSEGIVAVNQPQSGSNAAVIKCRIAGTGGVTFAGPTVDSCRIQLDGANDYSGDTWVRGVCLAVSKGSGLGNGTVHVDGGDYNGGEIRLAGAVSYANDFFVTGTGVGMTEGVLWFTANATMTGEIVLKEYDRNAVRIGAASRIRGTIDGPVSGAARLVVSGSGTVAFGAKNSFSALEIESDATVALKEGATPGDGEITVNGVLRLENTSDLVLGNRVLGSGTIVVAGTAKVEMPDVAGFAGRIIAEGSGTYDMKGGDLTVDELDTDGDYVNTGADATLTFGGGCPATFSGTVDGAVSLVKSGASVQYLTGVSTYSGSTTIEAGTLKLGDRAVSATLPVTDDILRLDACAGVTLEVGTDRVESWADADGKDIVFLNSNYQGLATPNSATLMGNHLNGLPAVHFDHSLIRYVASGVPCGAVTYFNVISYAHDDAPTAGLDGVFGKGGSDTGVRINGSSYGDAANDWINGVAGSSFVKNETHLFTRENLSALNWEGPAVGDYSPHKRPMSGDIGEIIVYGRALSKTERASVNDYLMLKWGIMEEPVPAKFTNILPPTTALVVSEGATVDLNGNDQTVASLELVGSLVNTSGRGATLTLVGDSKIAPNAIFGAPNLNLVLADGMTLDLGGGTFTIRRLTGCRSQVVNGTLIETRPRGGLLLILR